VRVLSNQIDRATWRNTLTYRVHPRLQVGVEYNPLAPDASPLANFIAVTETSKRPGLILTLSSDRIGTPYGLSYTATVSKELDDLTGLPASAWVGASYGTYDDRTRPVAGINVNFKPWMWSTVMFDGRKVHPMLNFQRGRHGFTFLLTQGHNPGVTYSVTF